MHPFASGQEPYQVSPTPQGGVDTSAAVSNTMVLRRADHQALYMQFQSRYPMGALVSELLQVHDGKYVVRVLAQVGGVTLSTGLAAAYAPESAEDQARLRALEVLGVIPLSEVTTQELQAELISPNPAFKGGSQSTYHSLAAASQAPAAEFSSVQSPIPTSPPVSQAVVQPPLLDLESTSDGTTFAEMGVGGGNSSLPEVQLPSVSAPRSASVARKPSVDRNKGAQPSRGKSKHNPPVDLSDVITQTSIEIKRLRWTEVQGRQYLQKAYGKRSRHELSVSQLLDFLKYLEAQPSPNEAML